MWHDTASPVTPPGRNRNNHGRLSNLLLENTSAGFLCNIANFVARPGRSAELGSKLVDLIAPSRAEAGCFRYEVYRAEGDSDRWVVLETWCSVDDLDAHMKSEHLAAFLTELPGLCGDGVALQRYREHDNT